MTHALGRKDDMSTILSTIKKNLGIMDDYTHFDADICVYSNAAFSTLHQLGVGPEEPFTVDADNDREWSDFISDEKYIGLVQTYVTMYVKLLFDPPQSSYATDLYSQKAKEIEWRLNVEFDKLKNEGE